MEDRFFRALLDLFMCADPYPCKGRHLVEELLTQEATTRNFDSWVTAYHNFVPREGGDDD